MDRWSGFFPSVNTAGVMIAIALVLCVLIFKNIQYKMFTFIIGLFLCFGMYWLQATGSRAGITGLFLSCLFLWVLKTIDWRHFTVLSVIAVAVWIIPCFLEDVSGLAFGRRMQDLGPMEVRCVLWRGGCSLIYDNYWYGVGKKALMPLMNTWHLTNGTRYLFGTLLNETLTTAAYWGMGVMSLVAIIFGAVLGNGVVAAHKGSRLAAAGVGVLIVVLWGGQFQTHFYSAGYWGKGSYILGIGLILIGTWRHWNRKSLVVGSAVGLLYALVITVCVWSFSDSPWKVSYQDGQMIAYPRYKEADRVLLVAGGEELSDKVLVGWLDKRLEHKDAIVMLSDEKPHVPDSLTDDIPCLVMANGKDTQRFGELAWNGCFGKFPVYLCDPDTLPRLSGGNTKEARIIVRVALGAPFVSISSCREIAENTDGVEIEAVNGGSAAWWWRCP